MSENILIGLKLLFILGFTLHNIEEALWLPAWSQYAGRFQRPVGSNAFIFAVIVITMIGYILTGLDLLYGNTGNMVNLLYLGFVGMMGLNSIFPHLIGTVVIKRYSPGLVTGLLLNLPFSAVIIYEYVHRGIDVSSLAVAVVMVSAVTLLWLRPLFKIGEKLINSRK